MNIDEDWISPSGLITIRNGELSGKMETVSEVKLTMKELKFLKRQLNAEKREINAQIQAIRAQHSQSNLRRGGSFRGGGKMGSFIRAMDRSGRDTERAAHARALDPYLSQRNQIDTRIATVDSAIAQLELALLKSEAADVKAASLSRKSIAGGKAFCAQCGAARSTKSRFCDQCGNRFE